MNLNIKLINQLISTSYLKSPKIINAFKQTDRICFVPEELRHEAYENYPLFIGHGQTISQPATVAFMLELLEPKPGEKILDVGCGSGWQTALLSNLVGDKGKVIGLEIKDELVEQCKNNLEQFDFKNIEIKKGNGWQGLPEQAPFDKIIVAAAANTVPEQLLKQLKIGGRMIVPVGRDIQDMTIINKVGKNQYEEESVPGFIFVPLVNNL